MQKRFLSSKKYDPGCSSRIRMLTFSHPRSRIQGSKRHLIPDPGSATLACKGKWGEEKGRGKKILLQVGTAATGKNILPQKWWLFCRLWYFLKDPNPDLSERLERLSVFANVATVLSSIPASFGGQSISKY
jgi:hypothetical protein